MSVSRCSRVEHRLFGTGPGPARKYSSHQGVWKAAGEGTVPDTLLGPEGSDGSPTSGRFTALDPYRGRTAERARKAPAPVGARPYVENYTVDASILKSLCIKFLRANGGCLGTRNRRRT